MKTLLFTLLFLLKFSIVSIGQYWKQIDLTIKKDKALFLEKQTKKVVFYDINRNKVIKVLDFKYGCVFDSIFNSGCDNNSASVNLGFTPNNKMFYIQSAFEDTTYTNKNWKPYRIYKFFNDNSGDTGWYNRKTVTLSTLNFYSTNNGKFLFSLKDTGFYHPDNAGGSYSIRWNYDTSARKPCCINYFEFIDNSDSLLIARTEKGFSIWDLTTQKKIFDDINTFGNDIKLTKDKKYFYRLYNHSYSPGHDGRMRDTKNDFDKLDVFDAKDLKLIDIKNKLKFEEKENEKIVLKENLVYDEKDNPLKLTEVKLYDYSNKTCKKYITIRNLTGNNLVFESNIFNCDSSYINFVPKNIKTTIGKIENVINLYNLKWYSNDSSIVVKRLTDTSVQVLNVKENKMIGTIKKDLYDTKFFFFNNQKLLTIRNDELYSVYKIENNRLIKIHQIKE